MITNMEAHLPVDPPVGAAALAVAAEAAIPLAIPGQPAAAPISMLTDAVTAAKQPAKKQHTELQKWAIVAECLCNYDWKKERLRENAAAEIAEKYDFSKRQIERILKSYFIQREEGALYPEFKRKVRNDKKRKRGHRNAKGEIGGVASVGKSSADDDEDTDSQPEMV